MPDNSERVLTALYEIRDLLQLVAEPAIAKRDQKLRDELRRIVGRSSPKAKTVLLMDGSRTQSALHAATGMHQGELSVLVKRLKENALLIGDGKQPKLAIRLPENFFEEGDSHG